jgi:hypothetical protein
MSGSDVHTRRRAREAPHIHPRVVLRVGGGRTLPARGSRQRAEACVGATERSAMLRREARQRQSCSRRWGGRCALRLLVLGVLIATKTRLHVVSAYPALHIPGGLAAGVHSLTQARG